MDGARLGDRSLFPTLEPRAYLNHAAMAPPSVPVRQAVQDFMDDHARLGSAAFGRWYARQQALREGLAELVGAEAEDIGLVPNTTQGVIDVALCLPWKKGDRVLVFEGEFPANVTPWQRAAELYGLELVFASLEPYARSHDEGLAALEQALATPTRLVAVSAVQFQTGLRMPVERMAQACHAHGAEIFVDGIQACGAVPMRLREAGVDYLSCGGHKWLMGLMGAGFLYVHPDRVGALRPVVAGWASHEDALGFLFQGPGLLRYDRPVRRRADFVEGGSPSAVGYAALGASVELLRQVGVEAIHAHVGRYLDALEAGLSERGFRSLRSPEPEGRSTLLGVLPPDGVDPVALVKALGERGVACAVPDGVVRFSPHWPNDPAEVPHVLAAVDEVLR
ncbi:MAG: aminotransferase class V-fold PLP-dependent enzyme [Myxococcota bacterium]